MIHPPPSRLLALLAAVAALALPAAATAAKPVVEPLVLEPFVEEQACGFPVLIETLRHREKAILFADRLLISGQLFSRLTNLDTGTSIDVQISGPGRLTFNEDGTVTARVLGASLLYLWPTDAGGPGMWIVHGQVTMVQDEDVNVLSIDVVGTRTDVCALLAA